MPRSGGIGTAESLRIETATTPTAPTVDLLFLFFAQDIHSTEGIPHIIVHVLGLARWPLFLWLDNNNLYIEVLAWDKVLKDAKMRNQIFFHKLGI